MSTERCDDEGGEAPCFAHLLEPDGALDTVTPPQESADDTPEDDRIDGTQVR
jgi:hypothetical protein